MDIYFGKVNHSLNSIDADGYYEFEGELYAYKIETDEEGICIKDTCGRCIPMDITEVDSAIMALSTYMQEEGDAVAYILDAPDVITIED